MVLSFFAAIGVSLILLFLIAAWIAGSIGIVVAVLSVPAYFWKLLRKNP